MGPWAPVDDLEEWRASGVGRALGRFPGGRDGPLEGRHHAGGGERRRGG